MATKRERAMINIKSVIDQEPGVKIDSYGNRKFGAGLRFKFNKNKWRFERKGLGGWHLYRSGFYTKTTVEEIVQCLDVVRYGLGN